MTQIGISEAEHGPPGARRYDKVPTYLLNGVTALHIEFTRASQLRLAGLRLASPRLRDWPA